MSEEILAKLVAVNSPAEAVKSFLVKRKSWEDIEFFGGQRNKLCRLCSTYVNMRIFADHLRDHNKCGDEHFTSPAEFKLLLVELPLSDIGAMLRAKGCANF